MVTVLAPTKNLQKSLQKDILRWYVMRDLKRPNAKMPAYKLLTEANIEVFTPMKWHIRVQGNKKIREEIPIMYDLLFVHDTIERLEPIIEATPTLQYRYKRGGYCEPMVVNDDEMQRFMYAVRMSDNPKYYLPEELTPAMIGKKIRIVGGPFDGFEGNLLKIRGSHTKRLIIKLEDLFTIAVEVNPDYVQLVEE